MDSENYSELLLANLQRVFGKRDSERRRIAIADLYLPDATLYEPDAVVVGHAAIDEAVTRLLAQLPPTFAFSPIGSVVGHHGLARLRWSGGPEPSRPMVTGTDVAHIEDGRIKSLYVLLDPAVE